MLDLMKVVSAARSATSRLVELSTRGLGDEGSDEQSEAADQVTFLSPLGLLVMPAARRSLRALVARVGGPVEAVAVALWDKQLEHDPAPENGETRLFAAGSPKTCVRLFGGVIEIRLGSNTGVLKLAPDSTNYQNKSIARVDDTTANGTLTIVAAGASPNWTLTATYTDASGVPSPAGAIAVTSAFISAFAGTITVPITGQITSGASQVKA